MSVTLGSRDVQHYHWHIEEADAPVSAMAHSSTDHY